MFYASCSAAIHWDFVVQFINNKDSFISIKKIKPFAGSMIVLITQSHTSSLCLSGLCYKSSLHLGHSTNSIIVSISQRAVTFNPITCYDRNSSTPHNIQHLVILRALFSQDLVHYLYTSIHDSITFPVCKSTWLH
jgi:hypothetical protein